MQNIIEESTNPQQEEKALLQSLQCELQKMKEKQDELERKLQNEKSARLQLESELHNERMARLQLENKVKAVFPTTQVEPSAPPSYISDQKVDCDISNEALPINEEFGEPVDEALREIKHGGESVVVDDPHAQAWLGYRLLMGIQIDCNILEAQGQLCMAKVRLDTPAGQWAKGLCCQEGFGEEKNDEAAVQWFRLAAQQGYKSAQSSLGVCYFEGRGVKRDQEEAGAWLQLAARQGDMVAQYNLGMGHQTFSLPLIYANYEAEYRRAKMWYQLSAEQGYGPAQVSLALLLYRAELPAAHYGNLSPSDFLKISKRSVKPSNPNEALKWFRLAADQKERVAQYYLGMFYEKGEVVSKNEAEAFKWFQLSAAQGYGDAQCKVGEYYENGKGGIPVDLEEADKFYRLAAEQGHTLALKKIRKRGSPIQFFSSWQKKDDTNLKTDSTEQKEERFHDINYMKEKAELGNVDLQAELGYLYLYGVGGVFKSYARAEYWLSLAIQHRDVPAGLWAQGICYAEGINVPEDKGEAAKYYCEAAAHNYPPAQYSLAQSYRYGEGMPVDLGEAKKYYELAAAQGNSEAKQVLEMEKKNCLVM